jgi:hypothetical protein
MDAEWKACGGGGKGEGLGLDLGWEGVTKVVKE